MFDFQIFYSKKINYLKELNIKNVIDVGVATGTKELLYNFPNAYYHLIEPNPTFHEYIYKNLLKKFKGKLYKIAAGNKSGTFEFYDFGATSGFLKRQDYKITKKIKVKLDKLDNIIKPKKKTLLKIDTEGYELEVLKGANKILNIADYCIIELRLQNIKTYNPSEIINYLYEKKFHLHAILKIYYVKNGIDFMDILFKKVKT